MQIQMRVQLLQKQEQDNSKPAYYCHKINDEYVQIYQCWLIVASVGEIISALAY